jgi:hypothetical protein
VATDLGSNPACWSVSHTKRAVSLSVVASRMEGVERESMEIMFPGEVERSGILRIVAAKARS